MNNALPIIRNQIACGLARSSARAAMAVAGITLLALAGTVGASSADDEKLPLTKPKEQHSTESPIAPEEAQYIQAAAMLPYDLWPIYFFECATPWRLDLVNWTDCTLYFITFHDCDGDGQVDTFDEHFILPYDHPTETPWVLTIKPKPDCPVLYWGLFDVIPAGDCMPGWSQDPYFPTAAHFY